MSCISTIFQEIVERRGVVGKAISYNGFIGLAVDILLRVKKEMPATTAQAILEQKVEDIQMLRGQQILGFIDYQHVPVIVRFFAKCVSSKFGKSLAEEIGGVFVQGPQVGQETGFLYQFVVECMNMMHLHRYGVECPFKAGTHMGREKPVKAQVQNLLSFSTLLKSPVQGDY